jgi:hypothetical protein
VTQFKRNLLRASARIYGLIALLMGLGLSALAVAIVYAQLSFYGFLPLNPFAAVVGLASVGFFCLAVGYRLFFNRPNKYDSLLSPLAWYAFSTALAFSAIVLGVIFLRDRAYHDLWAVCVPAFLSFLCAYSGRAAQNDTKNEKLAL